MNKLLLLATLLCSSELFAYPLTSGGVVVGDDKPYYKFRDDRNNLDIIYTKENLPFAKQSASIEPSIYSSYSKFFGWRLDEPLHVGLISDYNQIANGFSSQWPNNRQINYIGGTQLIDSFASTSWLETLLYHETAHNYQGNVKGSAVSRGLHSVLGNGSFLTLLPIIVPNVMENPFMLEGNAVLNESWHGNGGRLYNGFYKAETILQAKANKIIPAYVYNSRLAFPYGDIAYVQGSFFNLYLATKYGIQKVNSYFRYHSEDFLWPQFTNASLKKAVGNSFENELKLFSDRYKELSKDFVTAQGSPIAISQIFTPLSNTVDEIDFLINKSGTQKPELVVVNKRDKSILKKNGSWLQGKVIKQNGKYYTQGSSNTSPTRIYQGLYDSDTFIKEGSAGQMVQAYLSDGRALYFDVASSYSQPQLYVGTKFYAQVNSSVIVDKDDNIYYFKQEGKRRTLYRNREKLYSYIGFYGIVSDVDSHGNIYFIANSKLGSSLYMYSVSTKKVQRVSKADNIRAARLVNDDEVLLAAINDKEYYYIINYIEKSDEKPYETKLFFEDKEYYNQKLQQKSNTQVDMSSEYNSFLDMHYSGTDMSLYGYSFYSGFLGNINVDFADPLSQNSAELFVSKDLSDLTLAGASYTSALYKVQYSLLAYGVVDKDTRSDVNDGGIVVNATLPLYQAGYYYSSASLNYYQDYDVASREPLSATLTLSENKSYAKAMYSDYINMLNLYCVEDRGDMIVGGEHQFQYGLPKEFYVGTAAQYSLTNRDTQEGLRGVKLTNLAETLNDPSSIIMPTFESSAFVKRVWYAEVNVKKVMNISAYFFTFPTSLRRESIYANYRHYNVKSFSNNIYKANQMRLGMTLSSVFLNSFVFPISVEYLKTDASFVKDKEKIRIVLGATF